MKKDRSKTTCTQEKLRKLITGSIFISNEKFVVPLYTGLCRTYSDFNGNALEEADTNHYNRMPISR